MGSPKPDRNHDHPLEQFTGLQLDDSAREKLRQLLHELQVHQEELAAQNSQLIETQRALEESRDRFVDLYDFAPIGYVTIDVNGIVRQINLTGAELLGRERGKILGFPFHGFVADKRTFTDHLTHCRAADRSNVTIELELNTGRPHRHVQLITRCSGDTVAGEGYLTAIIDITGRKQLERDRREAEDARDRLTRDREIARARADAKDHFLATLSHELRTPLTPILATMSNTRLMSLAPEPLREALQTVRRNLDLEVRLIDDLLDVTRISRDRLVLATERVNVHLVLKEVVEMLGDEIRQHGVRVSTMLNAPTEWVIGDPIRLRQVFWNLLGNAIKFTTRGGHVTVTSAAGRDGFIQISVTDSGQGMDQTVVRSINEPDDSGDLPIQSSSGLGLGLAICRGVVNAHRGTLRAMSDGPGTGSTLVVQIPIAAHLERWDSPVRSDAPVVDGRQVVNRILLVEDHADSADTLSQLLTFSDYTVTVARNMAEAIALADQQFDLLISDIRLPDGSGLDLMRQLRARRPIRGIAISGFGTDQDRRRSRAAGYELHLTKPLDFNRLLDAIKRIGGRPSGAGPQI
jgi:PAS domain S-box-containing protein